MITRLLFALVVVGSGASIAHADPPRTAMLRTVVPEAEYESFGRAIERVARARADELDVIESTGTPALELDDLQLMVGCLAETPECYRAIAAQLEVQAILVPSLEIAGEEALITIAFYDDRNGEIRRVVRRARREFTEESLIDSIDGLLRELFGLPPAPEAAELPHDPPPDPVIPVVPPEEDDGTGLMVLSLSVAGAGVLALGGGFLFGALSEGNETDYREAPTNTMGEVDRANESFETAETQAAIANALFVVGGVLVAAGSALFVVLLATGDDDESTTTALAPVLFDDGDGPNGGGLVLRGAL
jgi:hypothetical protein